MLYIYILLKIILKLLLLLIIVITAVLLIPFYYEFIFNVNEGIDLSFKVKWARIFTIKGFFSNSEQKNIDILVFNKRVKLHSKVKEKGDKKKSRKKKKNLMHSNYWGQAKEVLGKDFINETIIYLKKITAILKPRNMSLNLQYGFEDPYATGVASGFMYFIESFFPDANIEAYPCFEEKIFNLNTSLDGKICFGRLLIRTIPYIFNKNVRKKLKSFKKAETFN